MFLKKNSNGKIPLSDTGVTNNFVYIDKLVFEKVVERDQNQVK